MMRILRNKGFLVSERQCTVDLYRRVVCRGDSGQRSLCEVTDQGQIEKGVIEDKLMADGPLGGRYLLVDHLLVDIMGARLLLRFGQGACALMPTGTIPILSLYVMFL